MLESRYYYGRARSEVRYKERKNSHFKVIRTIPAPRTTRYLTHQTEFRVRAPPTINAAWPLGPPFICPTRRTHAPPPPPPSSHAQSALVASLLAAGAPPPAPPSPPPPPRAH